MALHRFKVVLVAGLVFFMMGLLPQSLFAAASEDTTFTTIGGGKWSDSKNWTNGVPDKTMSAAINIPNLGSGAGIVDMDIDGICASLTIYSGGLSIATGNSLETGRLTVSADTLSMTGGTLTISTALGTTGSGAVDFKGGTVVYAIGSGSVNIGAYNYSNLSITGAAALSLSGNTAVSGSFSQSAGTLNMSTYSLTVNGSFSQSGGTFNAGSNTLTVRGGFARTAGTFNANTGTTLFSGSTASAVSGLTTTFNNLTVSKTLSLAAVTLSTDITVSGNFLLTFGSFGMGTRTVTVAGNWAQNGGSLARSSSTVVFNGSGASLVGGSVAPVFYNLTNNKTSATTTLNGNCTVNNSFTQSAGTFACGAYSLTVNADFTNNGGTFSAGTGTVIFVGDTPSAYGGSQDTTFYNFQMNKQLLIAELEGPGIENADIILSDTLTLNRSMTITGTVTLSNGTIDASSATITAQGHWYNYGTNFSPGTSTVQFTGSGASNVGGTQSTGFYNLTVNKSGVGSVALLVSVSADNDLTLTAGTLTHSAGTLSIYGNFTKNGGTFTYGTGTVQFVGSKDSVIGGSAPPNFYNLTVGKTSVSYSATLSSSTTVYGSVTVTNGVFAPGSTLTVNGNWTKNGGTISPGTGTVIFGGALDASIAGSSNSEFYNLTVNKISATVSLTNASTVANQFQLTGGTLDFSGPGTLPGAFNSMSTSGTTVIFSGSQNQDLRFNSGFSIFATVVVNKSGGVLGLNAASTISAFGQTWGSLCSAGFTITSGTVTLGSGTQGLYAGGSITLANSAAVALNGNAAAIAFSGDWTKGALATFTPGGNSSTGGVFNFGSGSSSISASNFNILYIAKTSNGVAHAAGSWTITHGLYVDDFNNSQANTAELESYTHSIGSIYARGKISNGANRGQVKFETSTVTITAAPGINTTLWGGSPTQQYNFGTGTVIYSPSGDATLPTGYAMYNLQINTGNLVTTSLTGSLTVSRDLTLTAGILDVTTNNHALNVGGNFANNGGSFTARTGTVTFITGRDTATVTGNTRFNNVTLNKSQALIIIIGEEPLEGDLGAGDLGGGEIGDGDLEPGDFELLKGTVDWYAGTDILGNLTLTLGILKFNAAVELQGEATVSSNAHLIFKAGGGMGMTGDASRIQVNGGLFEVSPATGTVTISYSGDSTDCDIEINADSTVDVNGLALVGLGGQGMNFTNVGSFVKLQNVSFTSCTSAQFMKFTTTGLMLNCPGVVFDNSVTNLGGKNVRVTDSDLGGDTHLMFEKLASSGAGAGDTFDDDGDKGTGGDTTANDNYSDFGGPVVAWVTGKTFSIRSLVTSPGASSYQVGYPKLVYNNYTFTPIGYVLGLVNADTAGNDLLVLVDTNGAYLDSVAIPPAQGNMTGIGLANANEKGTSLDIDGDGVAGEDQVHILIYVTTSTANVMRWYVESGKFAVSGAPSGWDTPFVGGDNSLTEFSSTPTADTDSVYIGARHSKGSNLLVWLNHGEADGARTLQTTKTSDKLPALQTALLILDINGTTKAFAGTETSADDGLAHVYQVDAGVDLVIEYDSLLKDPVKGIPTLRNNFLSVGTEGGEVVTVKLAKLEDYQIFAAEASPIRGGVFSDHLSNKWFGNLAGSLYAISSAGVQRYKISNLGGPITGTPIAAGPTVFVPVGNAMLQIADNPSNPVIQKRFAGQGTLSSVVVNSFNPGGPKVVTISSSGFYVQY